MMQRYREMSNEGDFSDISSYCRLSPVFGIFVWILSLFTDITADDIEYAINSRKGSGILLLLDNMDELSSSDEFYEVWDVIRGNLWPQCGIITTSKPALFKTEEKEDGSILVAFKETYQLCFIEGFNNIDVRNEVHRYFHGTSRVFSKSEQITMSRHICNLLRIYHRDIYEGYYSSPVLCSILCTAFLRSIESNGKHFLLSKVLPNDMY